MGWLWLVCPIVGAVIGTLYGVWRFRRLRARALREGQQAAAHGPLQHAQWEAVMRQRGASEAEIRRVRGGNASG